MEPEGAQDAAVLVIQFLRPLRRAVIDDEGAVRACGPLVKMGLKLDYRAMLIQANRQPGQYAHRTILP